MGYGYASTDASPQLLPVFRGRAELFTIQVQVVAARGELLPALTTHHFEVSMGGKPRVVRFAELIRTDALRPEAEDPATPLNITRNLMDDDGFFRPFPNRASSQYLLGIEVPQPDRMLSVGVKVNGRSLSVRRWMYRTNAALATLPVDQ